MKRRGNQITQEFFARDTLTVAQELIGRILCVESVCGRITETEAYTTDAASHAHRQTPRGRLMRETYGHAYVYFVYGTHYCFNITTERHGTGAVLIRALKPLEGIDIMQARRNISDMRNLANGPGKLCQALAINASHNGIPLGGAIKILAGTPTTHIARTPRIGISKATDLLWRFVELVE